MAIEKPVVFSRFAPDGRLRYSEPITLEEALGCCLRPTYKQQHYYADAFKVALRLLVEDEVAKPFSDRLKTVQLRNLAHKAARLALREQINEEQARKRNRGANA